MAQITYHQYRPGRWVKLVDGSPVGPASAEEVSVWQAERAKQTRTWTEVVQKALTPPEPSPPPDRTRTGSDAQTSARIWEDIITQPDAAKAFSTAPAPPASGEQAATSQPGVTIGEAIARARRGKPVVVEGGKICEIDDLAPFRRSPAVSAAPQEPASVATDLAATPVPAQPSVQAAPAAADVLPLDSEAEDRAAADQPVTGEPPVPAQASMPTTISQETGLAVEQVSVSAARKPVVSELGSTTKAPEPPPDVTAPPEDGAFVDVYAEELVERDDESGSDAPGSTGPEPLDSSMSPRRGRGGRPVAKAKATRSPPNRGRALSTGPSYLWIVIGAGDDAVTVVRNGLSRYQERFGMPAATVLCHPDELRALEDAGLLVDIRRGRSVPPRSLWIGSK